MKTSHTLVMATVAILFALILPAMAQERTSGSSQETQVTWTALKTLISEGDNTNAANLSATKQSINACSAAGMVYAPLEPSHDANGCIQIARLAELELKMESILRCNNDKGFLATNGMCRTMEESFETKIINAGHRNGCGYFPDTRTADRLCREANFTASTGVGVGSYGSPGDECVYTWDGNSWERHGALVANNMNNFIDKLTCFKAN